MPGASFHSFYWAVPPVTIPDAPLGSSASGGYVPWQTTVITVISLLLMVVPCL